MLPGFLLYQARALKYCAQDHSHKEKKNHWIQWSSNLRPLGHEVHFQPFPKQAPVFMCLQDKSFENTVAKGEIVCNEQFILFPYCFLPAFCHFHQI